MSAWMLVLSAVVTARFLTDVLRRYAVARGVLDVPNSRSAHSVPTPRSGGLAIVGTFLTGVGILTAVDGMRPSAAAALVGAGFGVAFVGFVDDHRPLAVRWRLVVHFAAAAWALIALKGLPPVEVFGATMDLGWFGHGVAMVSLVWLINLYNFMDGVDGIAGLEAVTVCVGASLLCVLQPDSSQEWIVPMLLASATTGFLFWNWPPARVFMGDAGSGSLGVMFGILAIDAARLRPELLWSWLILLGVFVVDATVTLVRRLARGERVHEAHRSHAYQHAACQMGRHRPVIVLVGAINLLWLLPMAVLVNLGRLDGVVGLLIAYSPLVWLGIVWGAGTEVSSRKT